MEELPLVNARDISRARNRWALFKVSKYRSIVVNIIRQDLLDFVSRFF